ncbi:endonuclease/exonuclease/phosphatase family protein [Nocardia yamanashiensis]|uniref:endonuclease/exonuclease/phosphatase family protein n=1 Tax=Nocardia yamanashiensis TaxID=209247 RepID=UPI0014717968|nr:endonuclease/exonuclease/phosphatase family protein [Nocardia yamanashiensis]
MRWKTMRWKPIAAWLAVVPGTVWAMIRIAGLDSWYPMVQLIAFTPYVTVLALLPLALTLVLRQRIAAVAGLAAVIALAACVLPRWFADSDPINGAKGADLRVLSANVLEGTADPEQLAALAADVDIVAVQELTPAFATAFARHFPYAVSYPAAGVGGSGIFSRLPIRDAGLRHNPWGFTQAIAELPSGVLIESVHPAAPWGREAVEPWRESYRRQPAATPDGAPRILLGDFNATLDHSTLRTLLDSGYRDAASVLGKGFTGTWGPYDGDPIPAVTLDHVLADRRIGIRDLRVLDLPTSDHRPVLATLVLP